MTPLVTCIVPVHNGGQYLAEAIDSILAQPHRPLEIIVVDDGSFDNSLRVAQSYGDRVTCLEQPRAGAAAARNRGVLAARGELIGFLDADDLWQPDKLSLQLERFADRPELDYCVGLLQNFWIDELREERERFREHRRAQPIRAYCTPVMLARRRAFDVVGLFSDELKHGSDTAWFLRANELGLQHEVLQHVLVRRRLHRSNFSRRRAAVSRDEYLSLVKATLDRRRGQAQPGLTLAAPLQPETD